MLSISPSNPVNFTIQTSPTLAPGSYPITVTGTSGQLQPDTKLFSLIVNAADCPTPQIPTQDISFGKLTPSINGREITQTFDLKLGSGNCMKDVAVSIEDNHVINPSILNGQLTVGCDNTVPPYTGKVPAELEDTLPNNVRVTLNFSIPTSNRNLPSVRASVEMAKGVVFVPGPNNNQVEFSRGNNQLGITFYIYDSDNKDITGVRYELRDSSGNVIRTIDASNIDQALVSTIANSRLAQGQSFAITQNFTGNIPSNIASVIVTVKAGSGSVSSSPGRRLRKANSTKAAKIPDGSLVLPTVTLTDFAQKREGN